MHKKSILFYFFKSLNSYKIKNLFQIKKFLLFVTNGAQEETCSSRLRSQPARDGSDTKMPFKAFFNFLFFKENCPLFKSPNSYKIKNLFQIKKFLLFVTNGAQEETWTLTPKATASKTVVSTNSTTWAYVFCFFASMVLDRRAPHSNVASISSNARSREYGSQIFAYAHFEPRTPHSNVASISSNARSREYGSNVSFAFANSHFRTSTNSTTWAYIRMLFAVPIIKYFKKLTEYRQFFRKSKFFCA